MIRNGRWLDVSGTNQMAGYDNWVPTTDSAQGKLGVG